MQLKDKVAVVTGGASGMGRAISLGYAKEGATVVIADIDLAGAHQVADEIEGMGGKSLVVEYNVADIASAEPLVKQVVAEFGSLDILVNNAGITRHARDHSDLDALSKADFMDTYAVNVAGPFMVLQACKALLVEAHKQTGRASAVLNVSSIAGVTGIGSSVAYAATKGALNTMTLSLARALAPAIRVNAVCPGFIGTRWFKDEMSEESYAKLEEGVAASVPLNVASGPDDIAASAVFFLTDASRHITGETLLVDAGMHLGYAPLTAR